MTIKLYDNYPYETEFTASVLSCSKLDENGFDLVLDQTLFFPEEGGQSCDKGYVSSETVNKAEVSDVQIDKNGTIHHRVNTCFEPGSSINGTINWEHRFNNMQQHSGEHIFSGIVNRRFGLDNVGFHLSDNEVTMDYNGPLTDEDIKAVEHEANMAIIKNIDVNCRYPSKEELSSIDYRSKKEIEGDIRIVTIPGYDCCACCAPHVAKTGEIGLLKVINHQSHRGGVRIWILCGFRAINEFKKLQCAASVVSKEFSVPANAESFSAAISVKNDSILSMKERISSLQETILSMQISSLDPSCENVTLFVEGLDEVKKRNILNDLVKIHSGYCSIYDGNDSDGYSFIIASEKLDCREAINKLKEKYGARGGGKPIMVQGFVKAARSELS